MALGAGRGSDQSSLELQAVTSAAVAASRATARSGGRKVIVLRMVAESARTFPYSYLSSGHR